MEKVVLALFGAVCILLVCLTAAMIQMKYGMRPIANCGIYTTYQEAVRAYNAGNHSLDHNKNGVPCETLL